MPRSEALVKDIIAHVYRLQEATVAARRSLLGDPTLDFEWRLQGHREATRPHPTRNTPRADIIEPLETLKITACDRLFDAQTPAEVYRIWEDFQRAIAELTLSDDPPSADPRT